MIRLKPLLRGSQGLLILVDLFMVGLILLNLSWIVFDSAYGIPELKYLMSLVLGDTVLEWYGRELNPYFYRYDLIFVAIFATELVLRWGWSVWTREYGHWLAYPVLHWYDVLGCIPLGEFRVLRLLRLFAVGVRLQKVGVINVRDWWLFQRLQKLYDIVMEELSDRVVIQVLGGMQQELRDGGELEQKILDGVIRPRQQKLVDSVGHRVAAIVTSAYENNREPLQAYVKERVSSAVHENREIRTIDRMPLVGGVVTGLLDHAITDIVCSVIEGAATDLGSDEFQNLFDAMANSALESLFSESDDPGNELTAVVIDLLDVIKAQVAKRRWLEGSAGKTVETNP